jgi:hypothetical protein
VLKAAGYIKLSHVARSLLVEILLQYKGGNNGRLLCNLNHLRKRGWNSNDTISRAKHELLEAGFIYETVKGQRPNKASWYAITWYTLDKHPSMDPAAVTAYTRGAYRKNEPLIPPDGTKGRRIVPQDGTKADSVVPRDGTVTTKFRYSSIPSDGDHLDIPSDTGFFSEEALGIGNVAA